MRKTIYLVIFHTHTRAGKLFDLTLLGIILCSVLSVLLESIDEIGLPYAPFFSSMEIFFTGLFTLEYILRVYSSPRRKKYILSFYGWVDLLAILPTYLGIIMGGTEGFMIIRSLRLLRVFRVLKLTRYMKEASALGNAIKTSMGKIAVFVFVVVMIAVIMGTIMYMVEGEENGFTSIPQSIYWAIVTLTTVGYGDISPATPIGQIIASLLMIMGYGIIAVPTGITTGEYVNPKNSQKRPKSGCNVLILSNLNRRFIKIKNTTFWYVQRYNLLSK